MPRFLLTRGIASVAAVFLSFGSGNVGELVSAGVTLYVSVAALSGPKATFRLLGATLTMAAPLAIVHGIINPQYLATYGAWGVPIRTAGLEYAMLTSARLALLFGVLGLWLGTPRRTWIALVAASRVPPAWSVAMLQAVTLSNLLAQRITRIRQAQRSRGILRDDMGLVSRTRAAVAVIVPLTAITLIDAAQRGELLHRMGFGSYPLLPTARLNAPEPLDVALSLCVVGATAFVLLG